MALEVGNFGHFFSLKQRTPNILYMLQTCCLKCILYIQILSTVGNTTLEVYNNRYLLRRYFKNEELRIFHCLFIVLKISLFSMPSCHDPVTGIFLCLFIFFEISCSPCHPVTIQWPECSFLVSLFSKSHCSPCHPVTIQWPECSILLLFSKSLCFPCHPVI